MNLENLWKLFENFSINTDDYLGSMFINIYKMMPLCYRIYFDETGKLCYTNSINNFSSIRKNIKHKIDIRKFIQNLFNDSNLNNKKFKICCYSTHEYLILGNSIPFLINVTLSEAGEISNYYEEIFCCEGDIDLIFNMIKDYVEFSETIENTSFGIAGVDQMNCVYTSWYDYTYKNIDIDANYNDDFKEPYKRICEIVNTDDMSSLILLYGDPGTGKTSVIKNLISNYPEKDFVFVDGELLINVPKEKLMSYFIESQNTIFILEDCEKVLMSRDKGFNPVINTLLNITDGVIGDVLGIKLICTFNTSLANIDKALLRKGRLSLKYEFKKLKAEKVSKILGREVKEDMTLADIYNEDENDFSKKDSHRIGF